MARKTCPKCGSTRYKDGPLGKVCKRCGFRNDPHYLERRREEYDSDSHR